MTETAEVLARMGAAEGGAAAVGFATLIHHLIDSGLITETLATTIRDQMLFGLDPSTAPASDRGLQLAYLNTVARFNFLASPLPPLLEEEWEGAVALRETERGLSNT